jgi:lysophospholipase L1-like esterase
VRKAYSYLGRTLLALIVLGACSMGGTLRAESVVHDKDRIIFCGDSITAQGGGSNGWVGLIGEGLAIAHPSGGQTLTSLGASGATVSAWQNIEKKSQVQAVLVDRPQPDVKATLDGGAEILVIMLGMNDLLSPGVKDTPADLDAWAVRYRSLIDALKLRVHPRVIALATITPCTEGLDSPKNRVEAELNTRLAALATAENAIVLSTHEAVVELLEKGRSYRPDFHVLRDYVHPAAVGHLAIAVGMLRGLGEADAAQQLMDKHSALFLPNPASLPTLSYTLTARPGSPDDAKAHFTVHYQWTPSVSSTADPVVTPTAPDGWEIVPPSLTAAKGDFEVSGPLDHLENKIVLDASSGDVKRQAEIDIPAAWRIATGMGKLLGWTSNSIYDPTKDVEPLDQALMQDSAWLSPIASLPGGSAPWQSYIASPDFTGRGLPGSIDMAAVTFFTYRGLAYGARWIYSDKDRPVDVTVSMQAFAGMFGLKVWLNDDIVYQGKPVAEPGKKHTTEGKLHRGWNRLWFKSSFLQWLWQFSIDVAGKPGDDLGDVRYATTPPPLAAPAPSQP